MTAFLVAGCTSDAGKSMIVAGLCRAFARRGMRVAPFKAQNMSNNSVVTPDGGEIGRAQALQATACGLEPSSLFNPILLKPGSDRTSQLIVHGQAVGEVSATNYIEHRQWLRSVAGQALKELENHYDLVICEGAGSPAEINLRATDIANFGLAEEADLPVYLVGDIDRGGVLAHFYGTHQIVEPSDRNRIQGFIVNKFRGEQSLLMPGLESLRALTGVPTLAVIPFIPDLWVDAEDSLQLTLGAQVGPLVSPPSGTQELEVVAIRLPRVSNTTDIEALACEPGVNVRWTQHCADMANADLVVLPGSKATVSDLEWLREQGLAEAIVMRCRENAPTLGICGGFQMLCATIDDPVEAQRERVVEGLGIFDIDIVFAEKKTLRRYNDGSFEVHHGQIQRSSEQPWLEGARRGQVRGTHKHGLMENDERRREFLQEVAESRGKHGFELAPNISFKAERDKQLDVIATTLEQTWDLDALLEEVKKWR